MIHGRDKKFTITVTVGVLGNKMKTTAWVEGPDRPPLKHRIVYLLSSKDCAGLVTSVLPVPLCILCVDGLLYP